MQRNVKSLAIAAGTFGFVLGALSGAPSDARGYFTRLGSAACHPAFPQNAHDYEVSDAEAHLASNARSVQKYACPIPDTTGMPKSSITTIQVFVYDNNPGTDATNQITARACAFNSFDRTGGSCGATVISTGANQQTLSPATTALSTPGETAYLYVVLPPALSGSIGSRIEHLYFGS